MIRVISLSKAIKHQNVGRIMLLGRSMHFVIAIILMALLPESAQSEQRSIFDWQWGMSCSEIERVYGKDNSSLIGDSHLLKYDWIRNSKKRMLTFTVKIVGFLIPDN